MRISTLLISSAIALSGCGQSASSGSSNPDQVVPLGIVMENIHAWNGKTVQTEGWLGRCEGLDCVIFPTHSAMVANEIWDDEANAWLGPSIGSSEDAGYEFEAQAKSLQHNYVVMTAKIDDTCWDAGCSDRANMLEPIAIRQIAVSSEEK